MIIKVSPNISPITLGGKFLMVKNVLSLDVRPASKLSISLAYNRPINKVYIVGLNTYLCLWVSVPWAAPWSWSIWLWYHLPLTVEHHNLKSKVRNHIIMSLSNGDDCYIFFTNLQPIHYTTENKSMYISNNDLLQLQIKSHWLCYMLCLCLLLSLKIILFWVILLNVQTKWITE